MQYVGRRIVKQGDAIPKHVAPGRSREDRPLPNTERRSGLDCYQPWGKAAELVVMRRPQTFQGGPGLSRSWDELPLIIADRARLRWRYRGWILRATGGA